MRQNQLYQAPYTGNQLFLQTLYPILSVFFERMAFYGLRSIFLLHAIDVILISRKSAVFHYDWLIYGIMLSRPIGGFVADKLLGYKFSMISGNALMAISCFLLSIPSQTTFIIGLILLILGNGLYSPAYTAQLLSSYNGHSRKLDGAYTFSYFAISAGALLGPLIVALIRSGGSSQSVFFVCGGFAVLAFIFSLLCKRKTPSPVNHEQSAWSLPKRILVIVVAILLTALFWTVFELHSASIDFSNQFSTERHYKIQIIAQLIVLGLGLLTGVIWFFKFTETKTKWLIGFSIALISVVLLYIMNKMMVNPIYMLVPYFIMHIAEIFGVTFLPPLIKRYTNPAFLATVIGISMGVSAFLGKEMIAFLYSDFIHLTYSSLLHLTLTVIPFVVVLLFVLKAKDPLKEPKEIEELDSLKENELLDQ